MSATRSDSVCTPQCAVHTAVNDFCSLSVGFSSKSQSNCTSFTQSSGSKFPSKKVKWHNHPKNYCASIEMRLCQLYVI